MRRALSFVINVLARLSSFDNKAQDEETVPAPFLRNFHRRQGVFYYISQ